MEISSLKPVFCGDSLHRKLAAGEFCSFYDSKLEAGIPSSCSRPLCGTNGQTVHPGAFEAKGSYVHMCGRGNIKASIGVGESPAEMRTYLISAKRLPGAPLPLARRPCS